MRELADKQVEIYTSATVKAITDLAGGQPNVKFFEATLKDFAL